MDSLKDPPGPQRRFRRTGLLKPLPGSRPMRLRPRDRRKSTPSPGPLRFLPTILNRRRQAFAEDHPGVLSITPDLSGLFEVVQS